MNFRIYWLVLLLTGLVKAQLWAQQFMLPPPTRQLTEPPGFDLFVVGMANDQHGNLWLTSRNGLVCFDGHKLRVYHDTSQAQEDKYSQVAPSSDGRIWLRQKRTGSSNRLAYFDPIQQRIIRPSDSTQLVRSFLAKYGFEHLFVDSRDQLWICLHDNGLLRVNPKTLKADHVLPLKSTVTCLAEGPDGRLWFSTSTGLGVFDPQTKKSQYYQQDAQLATGIKNAEISALRVRDNGDILIGGLNEIDVLTPTTGKIRTFSLPLPTPTSGMWTNEFVPDQFGNDYFSVGLMVFRLTKSGELQRLEFAQPAEKVISIFVQKGHSSTPDRLWVNAARRLDEYDLSRLRPIPYFNIVDVVVNGTRLIENEQKREDRLQRDSTGQASLTIKEGDFVQLRFTTSAESKVTEFRYKLDGYDRQWTSYYDKLGVVTYQPPPGQYSFLFNRAMNGGWEKQSAILRIRVQPFFWKTTWFRLLLLMGIGGLSFWLIRAANRRRKLRQELAHRELEADNLRKLDEFKSQFFTNVTHEFRTPLTIILNALEQLNDLSVNQRQQERLNAIQRNAHQLLRLINETLAIAKLDAGKLDQHHHLGDPFAFIEQVVAQFRGLAEEKGITLTWAVKPNTNVSDGQLYYFDDTKLEKISYNLLANALKFTPNRGTVWVEGSMAVNHRFVLRVADTGIGIPADQLPRIFDRFHQVDSSSTRAYSGTGIGLALVKELAEWLGGSVTVDSKVGQGSTFTVELPLALQLSENQIESIRLGTVADNLIELALMFPDVAKRDPTGVGETVPEESGQSRVLVVEDNAEMRTFIVESLSAQYQVLIAENGRVGLEQALKEIPDLIVSDVMMPELDGYELVERLKADERTSHIPVILLTAKSSYDSRMKGLGIGADDYLGKPFSLAELNLRIGNSLQTRQNWQHWLSNQLLPNPTSRTAPYLDKEERFLARLRQLILDHLDTETLDVDWLATQASMSRTQLHRKLTALTNLSPNRFIHRVRLEKAAELLQTGELNVAQTAYKVGYSSQSHFARVFQEHFGYPPAKLKV